MSTSKENRVNTTDAQNPSSNASEKKKDPQPPAIEAVKFFKLFRYADKSEKLFMVIGSLASAANGVCQPLTALIFGGMSEKFSSYSLQQTGGDTITDIIGPYALYFLAIALGTFILSYLSFAFWMIAGERQGIKFRTAYFSSLIKQEIGFYDTINPNEIASKVANECFDIQSGIGEKCSTFIYTMAMSLAGFLIGFLKGWQLALVLCSCIPLMAVTGGFFVAALQKAQRYRTESYNKAGAIAEESLNAIRTVTALCGQEGEIKRYSKFLVETKNLILKFVAISGLAVGFLMFFSNATWALGFWFGSKLIEDGTMNPITDSPYNVGDVLTIFFSILMGSSSLQQLTPCMKAFAAAKEAAAKAFKIIDKKSLISVDNPNGAKPERVVGNFTFEKVKFCYPIKAEKTVLNEVSFTIKPNQKTAFVGESGCGKTTCMQLLERFYDVTDGEIKLDGNNLKDLNLLWLRTKIGYVGQEPVLFATTIKENILFAKDDATETEIWDALKKANAEEFVKQLPKGLDTFVGNNGTQLSGGQKQRLAIARAILKNPPILLLDEATSALDRKNELEIQKTLDEISTGRTTIVIAHRLTTIQNADQILVFDKGVIVEEGKHDQLIAKRGKYYNLQKLQLKADEATEEVTTIKDNRDYTDDFAREEANHFVPTERPVKEGEIITDSKKIVPKAEEQPKKQNELAIDIKPKSEPKAHEEPKPATATEVVPATTANKKKEKKKPLTPEEKEALKKKKKLESEAMGRLFQYNKAERPWLILSFFVATVNGMIFPFFSIFLSNMIAIFASPNAPTFREESNRFSLYFFIAAIVSLVCNFVQSITLGVNAEGMTMKLRAELFRKLLKLPISFHDKPENGPGNLTTKLSTDCTVVNTLAGTTIGVAITAISCFLTGLVIAFISSWQLSLCVLGFMPLLVFSGRIQARTMQGFSANTDAAYQESGGFIAEAVVNMRTVASFGREDSLINSYVKKLQGPKNQAIKKGSWAGITFGLSQALMFIQNAYVFYLGAVFVQYHGLSYDNMFKSVFAIMFAAMMAGQCSQYIPDVAEAKNAAVHIFKILDTKPEIDIDDPNQTVTAPIKGEIEFKNVNFKYPTREKQVFENFNLKINASNKVAFVGSSGCGKSTIISLLLRFYDIQSGQILIDGVDIKKYNLTHLRRSFGIVSQEPTLFNGSIEYNIKYTKPEATEEEMRKSASEANCLKFIEANEFDTVGLLDNQKDYGAGFRRMVGPKGSQISGGQKQRIAIARAILPKPSVLLLDEATSALDAENEKIVQESLDKIMTNKTSICVAHRISTIKDADEIMVFSEGKIVERGTYTELTKKQGLFYNMERGIAH